MNLPIGTLLQGGKYKIVKKLGQGTFGITYHAEMKVRDKLGTLDFHVAIKEFFMKEKNERSSDGSVTCSRSSADTCEYYRKKFRHEAENLSKMRHDNIVKVSSIFDENNTTYYVMELVSGTSLDKYIERRLGLPEGEALRIFREAGSAVSYMHSRRMLHLDIKPNNIMRSNDGHIFMIDFGLSKQFNKNGEPETSSNVGGGTDGYAPSEQSGYKPDGSFPATLDVYALGGTLYKMLTGSTPPYPNEILNYGFDRKPLEGKSVSSATISVIEKAMEQKKADRYQTVQEMLSALPVIEEEEPEVIDMSEEDTPKTEDRKRDESNKKKFKTYTIGAIVLAVLFVIGFLFIFMPNKNKVNQLTEIEYQDAEVDNLNTVTDNDTSTSVAKPTTGTINGHEYVELGLSVKWATCNVGASSPTDYGSYFAWGETSTKPTYTRENSKTYGKRMGSIKSNSSYDAASVNWGGSWRLPTKAEFKELIDNCNSEWTTQDGVTGRKFTSKKNGKSIFLPAAGSRYKSPWSLNDGSLFDNVGRVGCYWSSSRYLTITEKAYSLHFNRDNCYTDWDYRYHGQSIRPVSD